MGPPQKRFSAFEGRGGATERTELSAKPEAEVAQFALNGAPAKAVLSFCGERRGNGADGAFGKAGSGGSAVCPDEMRRVDNAIAVSFGLSPERLV